MFSKTASLLTILIFINIVLPVQAEYHITGSVSLKGEWEYQIFLATVDKLDDYYNFNANLIVNSAPIDVDGSFTLTGDNLPGYSQFYRLYLIKAEHSEFNACMYVGGEDHNFVHVILDNNSSLEIWADTSQYAPFSDYTIVGDDENVEMKQLSRLVYPSYLFYEIKFPAELKLSEDKLNRDLFEFADTCKSTLVALAAINNTDYDSYIDAYASRYEKLGQQLNEKLKNHPYTKDYNRKLRYHKDDYTSSNSLWWKLLCFGFAFSSLILFWQNRKLNGQHAKQAKTQNKSMLNLTNQEIKILELIQQGKSNKEIASDLYIELSTVKSHINKLYAKLNVKSRKEAIEMTETL